MRSRFWILSLLLLVAVPVSAEDRWILISGTAGIFHTDARVFNPSFDKDIQVTAKFLPAPNPPQDNAASFNAAGTTFIVPKRSMHVLNDVTTVLFNSGALGAIFFTSSDPFEVTSRIYALDGQRTYGQFGPGLRADVAKTKGAILQMKANGPRGMVGTFRTNIGVVNPNPAETVVTWRLYDRNNALAGTGTTTLGPYAVTQPLAMTDARWFQTRQEPLDLSDAWVSYTATNPIFAYASVLDNGTEDQTFVPAVDDVGVAPQQPPPSEPTTHTFDVTLEDFSITFSPAPTNIMVGDTVRLRIQRIEGSHGFQMSNPHFANVVPNTIPSGSGAVERTFVATVPGQYDYFCTVSTCGAGHSNMVGSFRVGSGDPGNGGSGPGY